MKSINPDELICLHDYLDSYPIRIELVYAHSSPLNIFGAIYRPDAKLWLHRDLSNIVLEAADRVHKAYGYRLVLYDGLRTIEAQERMVKSDIVKANPHWLQEPGRLLSPPGTGAHPRAMAIDASLEDENGLLLDMGTVFDYLAENSSVEHNPAHREHPNLSEHIHRNRAILNNAMLGAAEKFEINLFPLPQEWWDFRFQATHYNQYAPLYDKDLPNEIRMCSQGLEINTRIALTE